MIDSYVNVYNSRKPETNGALLSGSRHLPTIYPVFSLKCASLPGLRPSSIPPGFNHKSTPLLSRVRGHACVCSACWLRGGWDLDRCHDWSLRRRGMFEDVFWHVALTLLQFVLILSNMY